METPRYLLVLAHYKWLLIVGVVVSLAVGLLAGYTLKDGEIVSRVERIYPASTTLLLSSPSTPLFQAEIPGQTVPVDPSVAVTPPVTLSLTDAALVYAYLVSGKDIQARVEDSIGALTEEESITSVSRTTQPSGDENFPGRLSLPVLDVVAYSTSPERAELISRTAAQEFTDYVTEQQNARNIAPELRVSLTTLRENKAGDGVGSNAAIPIIVAAGGTMVAFVALAFLLSAIRSRLSARTKRSGAEDEGREDYDDSFIDADDELAALPESTDASSGRPGSSDYRHSADTYRASVDDVEHDRSIRN
jgi:hypothetical protein